MTPKYPHDINKYSDIFKELTGIYPLKIKCALATNGKDVVIFKIDEDQRMTVQSCRRVLPYIELITTPQADRTVIVSYYVDTLFEAKYKRDKPKTTPDESVFTPKKYPPPPPAAPLPEQVYTVAFGEYDDYRVTAVFTTKEKAEAYADAQNEKQREEQIKKGHLVWYKYYYDDTLDLDPTL